MAKQKSQSRKEKAAADAAQLTFKPEVFFPTIRIPQPDGSFNFKAGPPVILDHSDEIGTAEAARIIGRSQRRINSILEEGVELVEGVDWRRVGARGNYLIKRAAALRLSGRTLGP